MSWSSGWRVEPDEVTAEKPKMTEKKHPRPYKRRGSDDPERIDTRSGFPRLNAAKRQIHSVPKVAVTNPRTPSILRVSD